MKASFPKVPLFVLFLSLIVFASNAQEKKPEIAAAKKGVPAQLPRINPKLPVPVQNLMKFMGRWVADATITVNGKTHRVEYHLAGRNVADASGIILEESFNDSILGKLKGVNLVGYDANDSKIHWYAVDNQGTTHEHTGGWSSSDSLTITHSSNQNGKSYTEKIDFAFKGRDELALNFVATLDGKETKKATGVFKRDLPHQKVSAIPGKAVEKK